MALRLRLPLALAALTLVVLPGCGQDGSEPGRGRATVAATTTQAADMVRAVAGERARVVQLLSPNADPHSYEPRPGDVRGLADAALLVRSGGDVDDWAGELANAAGGDRRVLSLAGAVRSIAERGKLDPHWWQDPRNGVAAVAAIAAALVRADPGGREAYRANARRYAGRLRRLDRSIADCMGRLPPRQRKLVTSHDALGYYARRYGLQVIGALIPSLSSQAQPSLRDTERLVAQIRRERVRAIFPESSLSPKLERAVARDSGARVGGALWADTLGPPGSPGASYIGSLADNTRKLAGGLSGGRLSCRPHA
jgi:ABC-type Zn uptake system ZnuABC Zn-binding protein ZnuA